MSSPRKNSPPAGRNRRGLSFLEFVGCLLALGSGVAIGSVYLGVDMKTLTVGILERAELVDPGFFGEQAVAQQTPFPAEDSPEPTDAFPAPADPVAPIAETVAAPQSENVETPAAENTQTTARSAETELTFEVSQAATLRYWQGLTTCIVAERQHRSLKSLDVENWQLYDYLTLRREGHQQAVDAIEKLDERGVDERLVWHGRQVLSWHQAGVKLYARAVDLLTDAPTDQLTGPFAQSWQSSATQHRMEEKLVREKHFSVASYLDHEYKDVAPFPPAF